MLFKSIDAENFIEWLTDNVLSKNLRQYVLDIDNVYTILSNSDYSHYKEGINEESFRESIGNVISKLNSFYNNYENLLKSYNVNSFKQLKRKYADDNNIKIQQNNEIINKTEMLQFDIINDATKVYN